MTSSAPGQPGSALPTEQVAKLVESIGKLASDQFSLAKAYVNVIIVAGYAAFFAIWSFNKNSITERGALWSALLLTVSLVVFITWETFQMFHITLYVQSFGRLLRGRTPEEMIAAFAEFDRQQQRRSLALIMVWRFVVPVAYLTGMGGVAIMGYQFVYRLISI